MVATVRDGGRLLTAEDEINGTPPFVGDGSALLHLDPGVERVAEAVAEKVEP